MTDAHRIAQEMADEMYESFADGIQAVADLYQEEAVKAHREGDPFTVEYARGARDASQRIARNLREIAARNKEAA